MKILLTGGGTGGHIFPILAIVSEIKRVKENIDFLWIGMKKSQEERFAERNNIPFKGISGGKLRRYFSWQNFFDFFKIPLGFIQAFFIIKKFKPDIVFGKGGYVSLSVVLASKLLGIPVLIHESDVFPGLTNRFLASFVDKIAITFAETKKYFTRYKDKLILTGNPIRPEILSANKKRGYRILGLDYGKPVILVIGGSQGAVKLNEVLVKALPDLLKKYQIIHLTGEKNIKEVLKNVALLKIEKNQIKNYHPYPFLLGEKIGDALICADLIISRAGSNTLSEIAALNKPSILIPYPYGSGGHQIENAKVFQRKGAAVLIEEAELNKNRLIEEINRLFSNREKLESMILKTFSLSHLEANQKIIKEILRQDKDA